MPYPSPAGGPEIGPRVFGEPGRTVGLFSAEVLRELIYALGCIPVRVFSTAGKPTLAEAYLPRNFCALSQLILASFLEDGEPGQEQRSLLADLKHRWLAGTVDTATYRRLRRMALTQDPVAANDWLRQAIKGAGERGCWGAEEQAREL